MKVTIFCFLNGIWSKGFGGSDIRFLEIAKKMLQEDFDIQVLTSRKGAHLLREHGLDKIRYHTFPDILDKFGIYIAYVLRTVWSLFFLFGKKRDIFYSTSDFFPDVVPPFLLKKKHTLWVQVIHHLYPKPLERKGNFIVNLVGYVCQNFSFALIRAKADLVIVVNRELKEALLQRGFLKETIHLSSNGIALKEFALISELGEKQYDGIMVGRVAPNKGVFDLPLIWKHVREVESNVRLGLIGGWAFEKNRAVLEDLIRENDQQGYIDLLGFLPRERVISLLKSAKVFVFPSYEEGWGIAIAEAMACGLPVVAWDLPIYKVVFENTIIQVEKGNHKKMAQIIVELLADEKKRKIIAEAGKEWIKKYDWETVAKQEVAVFHKLLKERGVLYESRDS